MKKILIVGIPLFAFLATSSINLKEIETDDIYITRDGGETWQTQSVQKGEISISSLDVLSLAVDPNNSDIVYLGSEGNGLYKSENKGESWQKIEDEKGGLSRFSDVYNIAIDPQNTSRLYIAVFDDSKGRVFRSENKGQSWQEIYALSQKRENIYTIAIDSQNPNVIYIGTGEGGIIKSSDYGDSWTWLIYLETAISDLVVNPQNNRQLFASTFNRGIYKSNSGGTIWLSLRDALRVFGRGRKIEKIAIDYRNPEIIYAASPGGLLRSENGGLVWRRTNASLFPFSSPISNIVINPQNSNHLCFGITQFLHCSDNQGQSWSISNVDNGRDIKTIAIDPKDSNAIYVGFVN